MGWPWHAAVASGAAAHTVAIGGGGLVPLCRMGASGTGVGDVAAVAMRPAVTSRGRRVLTAGVSNRCRYDSERELRS
jgi:hypothetical protein